MHSDLEPRPRTHRPRGHRKRGLYHSSRACPLFGEATFRRHIQRPKRSTNLSRPSISNRGVLLMKRKTEALAAGHGGRHERFNLLGARQPAPAEPVTSTLAGHLLRQWSWGQVSSVSLQQIALHAYNDQLALLRSLKMSEDGVVLRVSSGKGV